MLAAARRRVAAPRRGLATPAAFLPASARAKGRNPRSRGRALLKELEDEQARALAENQVVEDFRAGDHIAVKVRARGLDQDKLKVISGICIQKTGGPRGSKAMFSVRNIFDGVHLEWKMPLYSPWIVHIKRLRAMGERRAQCYHLVDKDTAFTAVKVDPDFMERSDRRGGTAKAAGRKMKPQIKHKFHKKMKKKFVEQARKDGKM